MQQIERPTFLKKTSLINKALARLLTADPHPLYP